MTNTHTPRTDDCCNRVFNGLREGDDYAAYVRVRDFARTLELELADANKLLALINKCTPDLIRDCHRVERLTGERDEAIARAEKAERAIETLAKILSSCSRSRNDYAKNFRTSEVGRIKAESERAKLREALQKLSEFATQTYLGNSDYRAALMQISDIARETLDETK